MNKKVLSIVIPTYNMDKYLKRCLDSISLSELSNQLEIIIVNDGSKDNSLKIARSFEKRFPQMISVIDKPNGNYGSCINKALPFATGKYFRILDADDWFDQEGLKNLIALLETINVDLVFTAYAEVRHSTSKLTIHKSNFTLKNTSLKMDDKHLLKFDAYHELAMHRMTYNTLLLKNINFRQLEGISYTDTEYVLYPLFHVKTVYFTDILLYKYFIGREGQTISPQAKIKNAPALLQIIQRMLKSNIEDINGTINRNWIIDYLTFVFATYYHIFLVIKRLTKEESTQLKDLDLSIKNFNSEIYHKLDAIKILNISYIKYWRKYNMQIISPKLYQFLKNVKINL